LPPTKIITYEEGDKAGICKVPEKLKEKIDKGKPLTQREHGLMQFLNNVNTSKQERIAKCIARARKIPLQPPVKATTQTQAGMDQESNPRNAQRIKLQIHGLMPSPGRNQSPMNLSKLKKIELSSHRQVATIIH
jgi:hypothetical protein